jgi:DNA-binding MarR family transcriptional regulator
MEKDAQIAENRQIIGLFLQTRDLFMNIKRKELRKYGVTFEEATVLLHIKILGEEATPVELSRWLLRKHHSITGLLSRMEKKGLILRNKDLKKKNMIRVSMTEKGQKLYQNAKTEDSLYRIIDLLSIAQKRHFVRCLNIMRNEALKELRIEDKPPVPTQSIP